MKIIKKQFTQNNSPPKILFVDDEPLTLKSLNRFGRSKNWSMVTSESGKDALKLLSNQEFDVIISDMKMPEMSGTEFLSCAKKLCPDSIRILLTGHSDIAPIEQAINDVNIHNYVAKPWNELELTAIVNNGIRFISEEKKRRQLEKTTKVKNKNLGKLALILDKQIKERTYEIEQTVTQLNQSKQQVKNNFFESLTVLTHILEWKEGGDAGHDRFVTMYSEKISRQLGLHDESIDNLKVAAILHRVGMLNISDAMRAKPIYQYNTEEKLLFKQVPIMGEMALSNAPSMKKVAKIIRHQQEHVNGNGYPDRITDREIPIESKIITVVSDFYDAFNGRLAHKIFGLEKAKDFIEEWKGKKYDTTVTHAFWAVLGDYSETTMGYTPILSDDLTPNMVLESDIVTQKGILLITKNTVLTKPIIEKIKTHEQCYQEKFIVKINTEN